MKLRTAFVFAFAALIHPARADPPAPPIVPNVKPIPAPAGQTGVPRTYASGRRVHLSLVRREAKRQGLPPDVADAVAQVESAYNPAAVGRVGEIGLMQVRPETAYLLGHRGSVEALFVSETNVRFGVAYLLQAWRLAGGDLCRALMKYRAGHGEEQMTPRSVDYCRRARIHLAAIRSPLAGAPLSAALAPRDSALRASREACAHRMQLVIIPPSPPNGTSRMAREMRSRQIWAAYNARMLAIRERLLPDRPLIPTCI